MSCSPLSVCGEFPQLLRGEPSALNRWLGERDSRRALFCCAVIALGAGAYGAATGVWRSDLQAFYAAIKLPLVILLTTFGNAMLNGMLAPLLGVNLSFRQSLMAILMSFTIAAAILGAFSPLLCFVVWNLPPLLPGAGVSQTTYSFILVVQAAIIAFAGITANLRLYQASRAWCGQPSAAIRVLLGWLAGNLFLGSQLSWMLRPFVGSPSIPVEFVRPNALESNFFEALLFSIRHLLS
jgi:hypothetical protein